MALDKNIRGITIAIDGDVSGLSKALDKVDSDTKGVQKELREINGLLKFDPGNIELLAQKQKLLGDAINNTSTRLDALKQAQSEVERQFKNGEIGEAAYRKFQREIAKTESDLKGLQAQADKVNIKLEAKTDDSKLDKLKSGLKEVGDVAKSVGKEIGENLEKGIKAGTVAIAGIGTAAAGAVVGVSAFVESQKEMSMDMARLRTNAEQAGMSMGVVNDAFTKVAAVSGEADSAVEAVSNLLATGMNDNQLGEALDYINGGAIRFSDTLKTEGIADGLQETFASNKAIGPFAELLERSGVNLDSFDKGLEKAQKNGEGMNYILEQLSTLGLKETYDSYLDNNKAIADYNLAQAESQRKLSELSDKMRPFVTSLMEMGNILLDVALGNKSLSEGFGELVEIVKGLATQFLNAAKEAIPKFVQGIQDALPQVVQTGINILLKLLEGFASKYPELTKTGLELFEKLVTVLTQNLPKILDSGGKIITTLITGITKNIPTLVTTALSLILKIATALIQNLPKIVSTGMDIIVSLVKGLGEAVPKIVDFLLTNLLPKMIKTIVDTEWIQIGKDIISGLANGIGQMASIAVDAVKGVVKSVVSTAKNFLGIKSPSTVFKEIGLWTGEGLAIGLNSSSDTVNKAMENIGDGILAVSNSYQKEYTNLIDEHNKKNENKEDAALKKIQSIRDGAAKKKKALTKAQLQEIAQLEAAYQDQKASNEIAFDKKYRALVEKSEKEYLEVIKNFIADKKSLEQMSLVDEAMIWEQSVELFVEGTKQRLEAQQNYKKSLEALNKEITSINSDFSTQIIKINEDLVKQEETLTKAYEDAVNKRAQSLYSFKNLFDEFKAEIEVTGEQLLTNLGSQIDGFKEWQREIEILAHKAIDEGLLDELREMGPNALPQLRALNSLTSDQLQKYSELYKEKSKLARTQAEAELIGMKSDTETQIGKLRAAAGKQLDYLRDEWQTKINNITKTTNDELMTLETIGLNAGRGLLNGLSEMHDPLIKKAKQIATSISRTIQEALQIKSPSKLMRGYGVNVGEGLILGMDDMISKVANSSGRLASAVSGVYGSLSSSSQQSKDVAKASVTKTSSTVDNSRYMQPQIQIVVQGGNNLTPSEIARKALQAQRQLALEWGL